MKNSNFTVAEEILIAAAKIGQQDQKEFSEWELTVGVWNNNKNKFGCRGYEDIYPDHKRVMMEIMSTSKSNLILRGLIKRTRPNHYKVTSKGFLEADQLSGTGGGTINKATPSPQLIYDCIIPYIDHQVFKNYCKDTEEPRTWLAAASFLGLTKNDPTQLAAQWRDINHAIASTEDWMKETGKNAMPRGVVGGSSRIRKSDVERLNEFLEVLKERFKIQLEAIEKPRK